MARFASATRQMLQRIDSLEKDIKEAQSEVAKHPSVFGIYDVIAPEPVKHSVSILVAKEKERDTFVEVAANFQKFAELVCRMESDKSIDLAQIIQEAKAVLKVTCRIVVISFGNTTCLTRMHQPSSASRSCPRAGKPGQHAKD